MIDIPAATIAISPGGFSGPTVDPDTGDIYIFRTRRVIKLNSSGELVWESDSVGQGEYGRSYGALSRDGLTFYYQSGNGSNGGKLYAFNTSNGTIKWSYPTDARASQWFGGPVVSLPQVQVAIHKVGQGAAVVLPGFGLRFLSAKWNQDQKERQQNRSITLEQKHHGIRKFRRNPVGKQY